MTDKLERICKDAAVANTKVSLEILLATCFHAGFLLGLYFDPEDGGDMFLRNVG
jgi:hypothetical protein